MALSQIVALMLVTFKRRDRRAICLHKHVYRIHGMDGNSVAREIAEVFLCLSASS